MPARSTRPSTAAHGTVSSTELRSRFAARLSSLYGAEVPAYRTLVEVSQEVNHRVLAREGTAAERLGSIDRVTAERHGAIRVGTPRELAQVARVFGALGMSACGFYDLRDAAPAPVPVVSTAFRPVDRTELAANPFRVFTSVLVPEDRRFFDPDLEARLHTFLAARELFPAELLDLADVAIAHGELPAADADRYLELAAESFALSPDPVDRVWYDELARVSGVAADIGGVTTTHVNHLTPRVLDIDDLYESMQSRGIEMIDEIQGPPRWDGPDVLLRQTSFRALAEPRTFRDADGRISTGALRVRFGEVEARGIALTPAGRERFDELVALWTVGSPTTRGSSRRRGCAGVARGTARHGARPVPRRSRLLHVPGRSRRGPRAADVGAGGRTGAGRPRRARPGRRPAPRADRLRGLPAPLGGRHLRLEPHGRRHGGRGPGRGRPRRRLDGGRHRDGGPRPRGALRAGGLGLAA